MGAALFGAVVGTAIGVVATLRGGIVESTMLRVVDLLMSFPTVILCLVVLTILGNSFSSVVLAIGIAFVPRFMRISRGPTLAARETAYVEAARAMGAGTLRIAFRHILPNIAGPVAIVAVLWMATAIRIEATLSFLGFGVRPPTPTWGNMIMDSFKVLSFAPSLSIYPGLALLIAVMGFNLLGDSLRDVLDPRTRRLTS